MIDVTHSRTSLSMSLDDGYRYFSMLNCQQFGDKQLQEKWNNMDAESKKFYCMTSNRRPCQPTWRARTLSTKTRLVNRLEGKRREAKVPMVLKTLPTHKNVKTSGNTYSAKRDETRMQRKPSSKSSFVGSQCAICYDSHSNVACVPCGHVLCRSCSDKHFAEADSCPFCRQVCTQLLKLYNPN